MTTQVLELCNVSKRFGEHLALDDISFSVAAGSIISLLGPSGCGKTTTLRTIAGFETPDSGQVLIAGQDMAGKRPYERNVGLLFQDYALFPHMTVAQNVAYGLRYRGVNRADAEKRTEDMLRARDARRSRRICSAPTPLGRSRFVTIQVCTTYRR